MSYIGCPDYALQRVVRNSVKSGMRGKLCILHDLSGELHGANELPR
jgi:hypothetical protein